MFALLGRISIRYRWLIVALWGVAVLAALPFAPFASQVLHSGGFTSPDAESQQAINLLIDKLKLKDTAVQIIYESKQKDLSVDDPRFPAEVEQSLSRLRNWSEVAGIATFVENPRQVSKDRHAAYVTVQLNASGDEAPKLLPELARRVQAVPDLEYHIGGSPVFYEDIQLVSENDLRRAELLAFPFAIVALLLVFHSVVAAVLPAIVGGCAVVIALALVYGAGQVTDLSIFVLNITTLFGLGLGVDYSLFIVSRFREELTQGRSVAEAVEITVATAGRAVAFSGLTVSIGLLGLVFFRINMLRSVGMGGMLVVILAVLAAVTLLPAMLAIVGPRINALPVRIPFLHRRETEVLHEGFWYRLSHFVMRYPVRVFLPVLLVLIGLGVPFLWVRFSAPDASILPAQVPSRQAYDLLAKRFDMRETTPIILAVQTQGNATTPENIRKLYAYVQRIEADPRVKRVDSIVSADPRFTLDQYELLYTHPELIADPYIGALFHSTVSGDTLMISVVSKYEMSDPRSQELALTIRNTPPGDGIKVLVDGGSAANVDYVDSLYSDFPIAVLLVFGITFVVLFLLFRSIVLPLKAILMNTLSILASYGALVVIFQEGFLHQVLGFAPLGFVEASSPILLFCALFGLSMDYEVFLLSRIQEEYWRTGDNTASVAVGLERSGRIITSAAVIVIVVSACFATADMILVKALGIGMTLAVILDATLVRGLLVPSTMRLLGDWNWWNPFSRNRHHPPVPHGESRTGTTSTVGGSNE
uniref:Putative conserved membrane protein, MmpL family n=1 Tax=Thermosporothrix sp. COM3 TaxID=2490863 RepID=A0A455SW77_9CHLR|nr:putative conserved membrane protein, MmpL family [Thermosporothrix sp. COM3]